MGDVLDITLPPYGAVILELTDTPGESIVEIPRRIRTVDKFVSNTNEVFEYPMHPAYKEITLNSHAIFTHELKVCLKNQHNANKEFLERKIPEWRKDKIPYTFAGAFPERLVMYIPFDGPKRPEEVRLFINDCEIEVEVFRLDSVSVSHYAFIEDYVKWGEDNNIRIEIKGLCENSFMGIYVDYPDGCDGILSEEIVFEERNSSQNIYSDQKLVIDSFEITPDVFSDIREDFSVTVKTSVNKELIEAVYFLHPTVPTTYELEYDAQNGYWTGNYESYDRASSIFCNPSGIAWIKSKDGGVGPKKECEISVRYAK